MEDLAYVGGEGPVEKPFGEYPVVRKDGVQDLLVERVSEVVADDFVKLGG